MSPVSAGPHPADTFFILTAGRAGTAAGKNLSRQTERVYMNFSLPLQVVFPLCVYIGMGMMYNALYLIHFTVAEAKLKFC